jgi:methionine--tRNA ligase beta chain
MLVQSMFLNDEDSQNTNDSPISIDDFLRVNLKVGKIFEAEAMKGLKKIIKVKVDVGSERREIAIGAAPHYEPDELVGKTVIVCTNLQRRKIGNLLSDGMILAADGFGGKPVLLTVDAREVPNGAMVH